MSRTAVVESPVLARSAPRPTVPLIVAGTALALSAAPGVMVFGNSAAFSEIAGTPAHMACYALSLVGLLALLLATPRLGALTSPSGRVLPSAALSAAVVATALNAGSVYVQVFVVTQLAQDIPAYLDEQAAGMLMVGMIGSWILYLVAWVTVGIVGLRRGVLPQVAGGVLILGAVLQPVFGPLSALPFGLGLLLLARATSSRSGH